MNIIQEQNVYAPPEAEVDTQPEFGKEILEFPRFTTWGVFGLAIVTLSLYLLYWLYSRTKIMNHVLPERGISMAFVWFVTILYLANMSLGFVEGFVEESYGPNEGLLLASNLINLMSSLSFLFWVFMFRNRLNTLSGEVSGSKYRASALITFFLQVFYLSYKVNQLIDRKKDPREQEK